jgi:hypothetical protein
MAKISNNPLVHFHSVRGATHFSILAPTTRYIAGQILGDKGAVTSILFSSDELNKPFKK